MREQWGSQAGFILAAVGSAVGLGNIWRFAYAAGENGGGAFLLVYLFVVLTLGVPLVVAEIAIGKHGRADGVTAFERLAPDSAWRRVGWLGVAGSALILAYYSVIAGWALRYFFAAARGTLWDRPPGGFAEGFSAFIAHPIEPLGWHAAMMALSMAVVVAGVARGIERACLWLMPMLALIVVALAGFALTLPGSSGGVAFLFGPTWSALLDPRVILAAMGQAFFSIGLGMAVYITYGGYLRPEQRIPGPAAAIVACDTTFAIIAGLAIFPAVFAFGGNPAAGAELAFITLPDIFLAMPGGRAVAIAFFFLLSAAALTSMISLIEVPVAALMQRAGLRRRVAVLAVGGAALLGGVPPALGYGPLAWLNVTGRPLLEEVDHVVSNLILPLAGFGLALFFGWVLPAGTALELAGIRGVAGALLLCAIRYLAPAFILGLMLFRLASG
ncbi:sodium-dependent transporter [Rubritepida flocculans]|uniref:sodium-dependent transporter n=1 Tax=Rubritepida flocculans TaxID=182403 RepID=UPI0003F94A40|nr:sodium-dependent transporter [Rubritepida flocculans]